MNIETLQPLAALVDLENIDLSNTKVRDESLRPLGNLKKLKVLNIANFYPMEEFAWLSKQLRNTKCTWFSPFVEFPIGGCKACGNNTMVMLTGKGKPMLCRRCDAKRLDQHVEAFSRAGN